MAEKTPITALIIEPDRASRDLISLTLKRLSIRVFTAGDYPEALALIKEHRPWLIVIAAVLPQINGLELIRDLKALGQLQKTHVIAVSALGYREIIEHALSAGANDFIVKPVDTSVLEGKVTHWMDSLPVSGFRE
jgi:CheY-like chemotaxis protein